MRDDIVNLQYTTIKDSLPDFIYKNLKEYSSGANLYRPQPIELVKELSKNHNIPEEMVYLTAGIDEAIQMFIHAYGQKVYVFTPTYVVYSDVEEFGGRLIRLPSIIKNEYKISTEAKSGATLIFLANPNNPSGITSREKVMELVANNKSAIVVVDEAYGEFANLSVINEVKKNKNIAVLRSFSKAYGMAGNRIGYIIANSELISVVKNKAQWSNVSYLSVGAALTALENEKYFEKMRSGINQRRNKFIRFLKRENFIILPSKINAVLIHFRSKKEGLRFNDFLELNKFKVSPGNGASNIGLDDSFIRIAIGNDKQMDKIMKVIKKYKK